MVAVSVMVAVRVGDPELVWVRVPVVVRDPVGEPLCVIVLVSVREPDEEGVADGNVAVRVHVVVAVTVLIGAGTVTDAVAAWVALGVAVLEEVEHPAWPNTTAPIPNAPAITIGLGLFIPTTGAARMARGRRGESPGASLPPARRAPGALGYLYPASTENFLNAFW